MTDVTRERLAELSQHPQNIQVEEIGPLVAMAARAVTLETSELVADHWRFEEAGAYKGEGRASQAMLHQAIGGHVCLELRHPVAPGGKSP